AELLGADAPVPVAVEAADPVGGDLFDRLVVTTPSGVDVLVSGRGVGRAGGLRVDLALGALQRQRHRYDLLVLDLPLTLETWMGGLVDASNRVCLVTGPQVTAVAALAEGRHPLAGLAGSGARTLVVLNRVGGACLDAAAVARSIGRAPDLQIPESDHLLRLGSLGWSAVAERWSDLTREGGPALVAGAGAGRPAS